MVKKDGRAEGFAFAFRTSTFRLPLSPIGLHFLFHSLPPFSMATRLPPPIRPTAVALPPPPPRPAPPRVIGPPPPRVVGAVKAAVRPVLVVAVSQPHVVALLPPVRPAVAAPPQQSIRPTVGALPPPKRPAPPSLAPPPKRAMAVAAPIQEQKTSPRDEAENDGDEEEEQEEAEEEAEEEEEDDEAGGDDVDDATSTMSVNIPDDISDSPPGERAASPPYVPTSPVAAPPPPAPKSSLAVTTLPPVRTTTPQAMMAKTTPAVPRPKPIGGLMPPPAGGGTIVPDPLSMSFPRPPSTSKYPLIAPGGGDHHIRHLTAGVPVPAADILRFDQRHVGIKTPIQRWLAPIAWFAVPFREGSQLQRYQTIWSMSRLKALTRIVLQKIINAQWLVSIKTQGQTAVLVICPEATGILLLGGDAKQGNVQCLAFPSLLKPLTHAQEGTRPSALFQGEYWTEQDGNTIRHVFVPSDMLAKGTPALPRYDNPQEWDLILCSYFLPQNPAVLQTQHMLPYISEHVIGSKTVRSNKTQQVLQLAIKSKRTIEDGGILEALKDRARFRHDEEGLVFHNPNYTFLGPGSTKVSYKMKKYHTMDMLTMALSKCKAHVPEEEFEVLGKEATSSLLPYIPLFVKQYRIVKLASVPCYLQHAAWKLQYVGMARAASRDLYEQIQRSSEEAFALMKAADPTHAEVGLFPTVVVEVEPATPTVPLQRVVQIRMEKSDGNAVGTLFGSLDASSCPLSLRELATKVQEWDPAEGQKILDYLDAEVHPPMVDAPDT